MNYKQKVSYIIGIFGLILVFLFTGCEKVSQNDNVVETQTATQEQKTEIFPQYESAETPKYKKLKKQIEIARKEVTRLEDKKKKLREEYTDDWYEVIEVCKRLVEAEKKLNQLKLLSDKERAKFGRKPEYFPFPF